MNTLTPKKGLGKKKTGETYRLQLVMSDLGVTPSELADKTEVSAKTITNYLYDSTPIGSKLLRKLHLIYGVSIDWLVSDVGSRYLPGREQGRANQVAEDQPTYDPGELTDSLGEWLLTATPRERNWMEIEVGLRMRLAKELRDG